MESLSRYMDTREPYKTPATLPLKALTPVGIERVVPAEPSRPSMSAGTPQASSTTERRLRHIIETAPVSLVILDERGHLLAANRAALQLLGHERPDQLVGASIGTIVATEDREQFGAFVAAVCRGEAGTLEYEVLRTDGSRLVLETHAVPMRRAEGDAAVVLGASWDVSARRRLVSALEHTEERYAAATSDRDALLAALDEARAATNSATSDRAVERLQADEAVSRLQAALAESDARHLRLASEWAAERGTLTINLALTEEENAQLTKQLEEEHASRTAALEASERESRQTLERDAEEHRRREQEWQAIQERHEAELASSRAERDQFAQAIQDLNRSYASLMSERPAERAELDTALRAERSRNSELIAEREQWRADLAAILRAFTDVGVHTQQLLDRGRDIRRVSTGTKGEQGETAEPGEASAVDAPTGTEPSCPGQF